MDRITTGDDDRGLEEGELHPPEDLRRARPEDPRRVDELLRQGGEAGEEDEKGERGPLPYVGEDDRPLRREGVGQPPDARIDAEGLEERGEDLVERATVDVDHREVVADDDRHHHHRGEEDRDVEAPPPEVPVEKIGEDEPDQQLEDDRCPREVEGAPEGHPELILAEDAPVVEESAERRLLEGAGSRASGAG